MSATTFAKPLSAAAVAQAEKAAQFASDKLRMAKAIKASREAAGTAQSVGRGARQWAKDRPGTTGGLLAAVMSSPALYHGTVKVGATAIKTAGKAVTGTLHAASMATGWAFHAAASAVGYLFPAGGTFIRSIGHAVTGSITNTALRIDEVITMAVDVTYSMLVSPTVTKTVTRTANAISWLMFVRIVTLGRSALWLSRIPVVGPYLAAVSLGGQAVFFALRTALYLGVMWGLINRPNEMLAVYRGEAEAPSFKDEFRSEFHFRLASKKLVEEVEEALAEAAEETEADEVLSEEEAAAMAETIDELTAQAERDLVEADAIIAQMRRPANPNRTSNQNRNRNRNRNRKSA